MSIDHENLGENLPPDEHYPDDEIPEGGHLPEDEYEDEVGRGQAGPAQKSGLNFKKIGLLGAGVLAIGGGLTLAPSYFSSDSTPSAGHSTSPHTPHKATFKPPAIAQNSSAPLPDQAVNPQQNIQPLNDPQRNIQPPNDVNNGIQRPDFDRTATQATIPIPPNGMADKPSSPLDAPFPDPGVSHPPSQTAPAAPTQPAFAQNQATQPPQKDGPPDASLTDILNALHDNNDTVAQHLDSAAATISQHIDNKSDAVISKIDAMQTTINALSEKTDAMSKTLTDMEEHGLQRPVERANVAHNNNTSHVTVKRRRYRMTVTASDKKAPDLSAYHLRGVSKKMVIIQGPDGYMTVPIGSSANATVGVVNGIERRGDQWVVSTTNGTISE